jgi:hypothetical protein
MPVLAESTLERFIFTRMERDTQAQPGPETESGAPSQTRVLAISPDLPPEEAQRLAEWVTLAAPTDGDTPSASIALLATGDPEDTRSLLARCAWRGRRLLTACLILPHAYLQTLAGNLTSLIELADDLLSIPLPAASIDDQDIPAPEDYDAPTLPRPGLIALPAIGLPPTPTWTADKRLAALNGLINGGQGEARSMQVVFTLLAAALSERGVLVRGLDPHTRDRYGLAQSLMLLLPSPARPILTFATHTDDPAPPPARARVIFRDRVHRSPRWVVDLAAGSAPPYDTVKTPYTDSLIALWHGDMPGFASDLRAMEIMAARLMAGRLAGDRSADRSLLEALNAVGQRALLDAQVSGDGEVPIEALQAVMSGGLNAPEAPPPGPLRGRYAGRLLTHALTERDADSAELTARAMDDDPEVERALNEPLEAALADEPDAVYFFVRTHLSRLPADSGAQTDRWLARLSDSAARSLQIAIQDADSDTLIEWLRLIAREPAAYQLGDILQRGLLAAQERAHDDGRLAAMLIPFAARRVPGAVDRLLDDAELIAALPDPLGTALREPDAEGLVAAMGLGREVALIAFGRAVRLAAGGSSQASAALTPDALDRLWSIATESAPALAPNPGGVPPNPAALPEPYQAPRLMQTLIEDGANWLPAESIRRLLAVLIGGDRTDQFLALLNQLTARDDLPALVADALQEAEIAPEGVLNAVGQAMGAEIITPQQAVNIYLRAVAATGWNRAALPLAEQIARLMQQQAALTVPPDVLWRMAQLGSDLRTELPARVATRRILNIIGQEEDAAAQIDALQRLYDLLAWNPVLREVLMNWWRDQVRDQPPDRLHALDAALEGRRTLEDLSSAIHTTLALRRMFGKRSLEDFADAVNTAHSILQAIVDSFNADPRGFDFDGATFRAELDARRDELTPDERRVLAKNLKELAALVGQMADHRSRASLTRREGDIERGLFSGEQDPASAIDALKWLSGYWDSQRDSAPDTP